MTAKKEWQWTDSSPFDGFRAPAAPPPRHRRVAPGEVKRICRDLNYRTGRPPLDALFRKTTKRLGIADLHFHDSRAEALTRLSRKVDVMTLAKISGHKDLRVLQETYYRETAEQIAARL